VPVALGPGAAGHLGTGNWIHLWVTLRNLADLLRRLGDDVPATLIDAAADRAPDAPATGPAPAGSPVPVTSTPAGRTAVLDAARQAIERNLSRRHHGTRR
jgi:hypothetical protein